MTNSSYDTTVVFKSTDPVRAAESINGGLFDEQVIERLLNWSTQHLANAHHRWNSNKAALICSAKDIDAPMTLWVASNARRYSWLCKFAKELLDAYMVVTHKWPDAADVLELIDHPPLMCDIGPLEPFLQEHWCELLERS